MVNDVSKAETRFPQVSIMELNKLNHAADTSKLGVSAAINDVKIHWLRLWWRKECKGRLDYRLHGIRGKGGRNMIWGFTWNRPALSNPVGCIEGRSQYRTVNCEGRSRERLSRDTGGRLSRSSEEVRESG